MVGEYPYLSDIANAREDYLHTTCEATRLDAWGELRAAEQDLQRYRECLEPDKDAAQWSADPGRRTRGRRRAGLLALGQATGEHVQDPRPSSQMPLASSRQPRSGPPFRSSRTTPARRVPCSQPPSTRQGRTARTGTRWTPARCWQVPARQTRRTRPGWGSPAGTQRRSRALLTWRRGGR
jgi:hypothetical protein